MPFNDLEKKRIENALDKFLAKRRPPPQLRKELDFGYALTGQSVELLEIRPQWDDPAIIRRRPVAKATYVKVQDCWKIFWMRASLKWPRSMNSWLWSIGISMDASGGDYLAISCRDNHEGIQAG